MVEEGVVEGFLLGGLEVDVFPVGGGVVGEVGGAGAEVIEVEEGRVEMAWWEAAGAAVGGVGGEPPTEEACLESYPEGGEGGHWGAVLCSRFSVCLLGDWQKNGGR